MGRLAWGGGGQGSERRLNETKVKSDVSKNTARKPYGKIITNKRIKMLAGIN